MTNILIACDSFKRSLSSKQANNAIKEGVQVSLKESNIKCVSMADGGERTLDAFFENLECTKIEYVGNNHYNLPVKTYYLYNEKEKTVYIDIAGVSGLHLVSVENRNIIQATSFGFGCLIKDSLRLKPKHIVVCLGGSGCSDGGIGMLYGLNAKFLDAYNNLITPTINNYKLIDKIDLSETLKLFEKTHITVACDVSNPYCGKDSASLVYSKQKGASETEALMLEESLIHINEIFKKQFSCDLKDLPKTGCAGGISGALYLLDAKLESGIDLVLKLVDFKTKLKNIDLVITGEGSTDSQTMYGKTISGIARLSKESNVGVIVISGRIKDADNLYEIGVSAMFSILNEVMDLETAMNNGYELLKKQAENIGRLIKTI